MRLDSGALIERMSGRRPIPRTPSDSSNSGSSVISFMNKKNKPPPKRYIATNGTSVTGPLTRYINAMKRKELIERWKRTGLGERPTYLPSNYSSSGGRHTRRRSKKSHGTQRRKRGPHRS